ncbi:unnamed protein product [Somion occarium]|uniref:DUF6534 domain-containing protein n=2 Tax=Somion occarium TaxID=3059160 RepID=A0ABP1CGV6_9APHY
MAESMQDISIDNLLGSYVIVSCLALIIYGIGAAQSYMYMLNCDKDPTWLKALVSTVALLEAVHTAFVIHITYNFTITGFGNLEVIGKVAWSPPTAVIVENVIVALVQGFFISRIWLLSRENTAMTIVLACLLTIRIGFGLTIGSLAFVYPTWETFHNARGAMIISNFTDCLGVVVDGAIAGCLVYYFHRDWRTGRRFNARIDWVLRWLMAYAINTGVITMIISICVMVTFVTLKMNFIFLGLNVLASKLYANSLLGTLNARRMLHARTLQCGPQSISGTGISSLAFSDPTKTSATEVLREVTSVGDVEQQVELQVRGSQTISSA